MNKQKMAKAMAKPKTITLPLNAAGQIGLRDLMDLPIFDEITGRTVSIKDIFLLEAEIQNLTHRLDRTRQAAKALIDDISK